MGVTATLAPANVPGGGLRPPEVRFAPANGQLAQSLQAWSYIPIRLGTPPLEAELVIAQSDEVDHVDGGFGAEPGGLAGAIHFIEHTLG